VPAAQAPDRDPAARFFSTDFSFQIKGLYPCFNTVTRRSADQAAARRLWSSGPVAASRVAMAEALPLRHTWDVGALLLATSDLLAARFGAVAVRGELSGFTRAASGHCYFSLKDSGGAPALLRCAMFRRAAGLLDFRPADGQQVELRGRLGVYDARGELQLVVESMQRVGAGTLYEEFLRLRARLQAAGLFDPARKRPLPPHPRALGVVTSLQAAALRDVLSALARRVPHLPVVVYPCPVQGPEAPPAIAAALALAAGRAEVDLLLLVRGGGALEDLWAFNDERVVRAVAASPLPVVCGVGHETDVTLADLAADLRAPTPTAAAELAAPAREDLLAALDGSAAALRRAAERLLQARAQRLDRLALRLGQPAAALAEQRRHLLALQHRLALAAAQVRSAQAQALQRQAQALARGLQRALQQQRWRLQTQAQRLQALDPQQVLQRGYAWVEDEQGRAVTAAAALQPGQRVSAVWHDGRAQAQVLAVLPGERQATGG
jgi:exodeoxyribonuclease VII large subunit